MASTNASILPPKSKPSIVLVHGFRGSPLGLEVIAQDLRQAGYQVYLPPIPPFAGAEELERYRPKDYANYLASYIRKRKLERPILVGHSMGSVIVAATAKLHPELVNQKLVLLSPISVKTAKPFAAVSPLATIVPRPVVDYVTTRFLFIPKDKQLFRDTIIAGAKDRLIPQKKTRELAQQLQAKLQFIPGSGHLHNYEKPHETAQLILDFLKS